MYAMALTLRQLQYFIAVTEMGSITHAAGRLRVAPTAVSLQIKAMEDDLGVALLERHSRGVAPTAAGQELILRARQIREAVEEARRAVVAAAGRPVARQIRIGAPPAVARLIGVEAILAADARRDGISLQVTEGWTAELVNLVREGGVDLAIGYGLGPEPGLKVRELFAERFVFAAAPGIGPPGPTIGIAAALASDLVFYGERSISWREAEAAARRLGLPLPARRWVASVDVWRKFLLQGLGTAISPFAAVAEECHRGELVVQEIEGATIEARLGVATRDDAGGLPPGFADFIADLIGRAFRRMDPQFRLRDHPPPSPAAAASR